MRGASVVVGGGGRIVSMNAAARHLMQARDGLQLRDGAVATSSRDTDSEVRASIANALDAQITGTGSEHYVVCARPSGRRPYVLRLASIAGERDPHQAHRVLMTIVDPEQQPKPPAALLRKLFGLTAAECDVAQQMLSGRNLEAIAAHASVSTATTRTHLRRIFYKTNTHRQAELIRLLIAVTP